MKLIQLHLHPFAGTVNRTYNFENGLNVIFGDNEAGKSTMVKALLLSLLESTDLTKSEFKNLITNHLPIGGDTINIDLQFEVSGVVYELKKSWGANNTSSLNAIGQAPINNPENVQVELFRLMNINKSTLKDVIFTTQAKIASTIEGINKNPEIGNSLDQILRSAIFNTGGIVPEALKAQLDEEYEDLVQNWKLDEDAPVIKSNNKGAYENKWEKGLGEILKIAYELYGKQSALTTRLDYDQKLNEITCKIIELQEKVNADRAYTDSKRPLLESLTKRKEIDFEKEKINARKKEFQEVQINWNTIIANLPVLKAKLIADESQLGQLKIELENAKKSEGISIKRIQFNKVNELKLKLEEHTKLKNEVKVIKDSDIASTKKIYEALVKAQNTIDALESAQKFAVEIQPKKNLEVEIQQGDGLVEKIKLTQNNPFAIEVNKGFVYESEEVLIQVKSLTDQIGALKKEILELGEKLAAEFLKYNVKDIEVLNQLYLDYKKVLQDYEIAKTSFDLAVSGTSFEVLEKELNDLQNLPKTREKADIEILQNDLIGNIATDKIKIKGFEENIISYETNYTNLDNLDDLRLALKQEEITAKSNLDALPAIEEGLDIESFKEMYEATLFRLKANEGLLIAEELKRATLEGGQPEVLASELQDEIDLLIRQKNQKTEEAKAIRRVLAKLDEILLRVPANPYQDYENNLTQYLNTLSGGKYEVATNGDVTPSVIKNSNTNLLLPIELLSEGTSGVLGLSLRLAMADYYLANQNGFLAFDDPMVHFDEGRQAHASQCFQQYAENKQVLIFTCHQSHANQLGGNLISLN